MNRRTVLAGGLTLVSAIAGCSTTGSDAIDGGTLKIVGVEADPPPDLPLEPAVSIVTGESTETTPGRVAIRWENVGDGPVRVGEADSIVFSATKSEDGSAHLLAFDRIGDRSDAVAFDDCWHITEELGFDAEYEIVDLEAGARHTAEPALYTTDASCLDTGSYRFTTQVSVRPRDSQEKETGDWGFNLDIERG